MAYKRADELFPKDLLKRIAPYAEGHTVYFPRLGEKRPWGSSGKKQALEARNRRIREEHAQGWSLEKLAERYELSEDSLRRILYRK